jgi:hypothetical protein
MEISMETEKPMVFVYWFGFSNKTVPFTGLKYKTYITDKMETKY